MSWWEPGGSGVLAGDSEITGWADILAVHEHTGASGIDTRFQISRAGRLSDEGSPGRGQGENASLRLEQSRSVCRGSHLVRLAHSLHRGQAHSGIVIRQESRSRCAVSVCYWFWGAFCPRGRKQFRRAGTGPPTAATRVGRATRRSTRSTRRTWRTLGRAWTFHTGEKGRSFESTPIFVDNVLYVSTHTQKVIALDPETGRELWRYDAKAPGRENRGVSYWPGDGRDAPRILLGTGDGRLIALSTPRPAFPIQSFGDNGVVNLRAGITDKFPKAMYGITSPPTIYSDLVIVGPATQEGPSAGPSGDPRAFDVRTGKLRWRFHVIPESGRELGDGRREGSLRSQPVGLRDAGCASAAWSFCRWEIRPIASTARTARGRISTPTRVVALDAATGKMLWYYQVVHHDIWDYDLAAPPALIEVKRDGKTIPAVAQITKMGLLFILDRMTGKPVFGVEERPVPKSDVPGEESWPTQPFPLKPPPLARMSMTAADLTTRTPEAHKFCAEWFAKLRHEGAVHAVRHVADADFPGNDGRRKLGRRVVRSRGSGTSSSTPAAWAARASMVAAPGGRADAVSQRGRLHALPGSGPVSLPAAAVGRVDRGQREHRRRRVARPAGQLRPGGGAWG